jgi:hypothetical protein
VIRVDQTRIDNTVFKARQETEEILGRPRLRWLEGAEYDLRELIVKRWRNKIITETTRRLL